MKLALCLAAFLAEGHELSAASLLQRSKKRLAADICRLGRGRRGAGGPEPLGGSLWLPAFRWIVFESGSQKIAATFARGWLCLKPSNQTRILGESERKKRHQTSRSCRFLFLRFVAETRGLQLRGAHGLTGIPNDVTVPSWQEFHDQTRTRRQFQGGTKACHRGLGSKARGVRARCQLHL